MKIILAKFRAALFEKNVKTT